MFWESDAVDADGDGELGVVLEEGLLDVGDMGLLGVNDMLCI